MKYEQIAESIINGIKSGEYPPNSKIPSETELLNTFNTSRMTVRKGIESVVSMGYIYSVKGKGSFVVDDGSKHEIDLNDMAGFTQRTLNWGKKPRSDVRCLVKKEINSMVKKHFPQNIDEALYIEIIRYVDDSPLAVEYDYIDPRYLDKISLEDVTNSLSTYIQSQDLHIARLKKEYKAVIPHNTVSNLLHIPNNTPVMRIDYCRYLDNGDLLEYAKVFYNQTIFKFVQDVEP